MAHKNPSLYMPIIFVFYKFWTKHDKEIPTSQIPPKNGHSYQSLSRKPCKHKYNYSHWDYSEKSIWHNIDMKHFYYNIYP